MAPPHHGRDERRVPIEVGARGALVALVLSTSLVLAAAVVAASLPPGLPGYATAGVLFALDLESNVPSFFSTLLLLLAACLLALRARVAAVLERRWRLHWALLAAGFLALALDEAAQIHERTGALVPGPLRPPGFAAPWVIPATVLVAGLALAYLPFVRALPRRARRLFVGSGLLYLAGALGLEAAGGAVVDCYLPGCAGLGSPAYALAVFLEEACEMLGVAWFVHALLDDLGRLGVAFSLRVAPPRGTTPRRSPPPRPAPGRPGSPPRPRPGAGG